MRKVLLAGVLMAAVLVGLDPLGAQSCAVCQPTRIDSDLERFSGTIEVCFEADPYASPPDWSTWQRDTELKAGFAYWKSVMEKMDRTLNFQYRYGAGVGSCDGAQIRVRTESMSATVAGLGSPTYGISINRDKLNDPNWDPRRTAGHEMGHVLGWDNVYTNGCDSQTIMYFTNTPMPADVACGDLTAASTAYRGNNTEDGGQDYEPSNDMEDCYDVYLVVHYFYYDGQNWHYAGFVRYYLGIHCPPPI